MSKFIWWLWKVTENWSHQGRAGKMKDELGLEVVTAI